jgi:hypothetical protein
MLSVFFPEDVDVEEDESSFFLCGDDLSKCGISGGCYYAICPRHESVEGKVVGFIDPQFWLARALRKNPEHKFPFFPYEKIDETVPDQLDFESMPKSTFVEYLRIVFLWGGMPGFAWNEEQDQVPETLVDIMVQITAGLLAI